MPTKRLYLLRHAKSSWEDARVPDHERRLPPPGRGAAALLAEHFRAVEIQPEYVLCSSARRTRETVAGVLGDGAHKFPTAALATLEFDGPLVRARARELAGGRVCASRDTRLN